MAEAARAFDETVSPRIIKILSKRQLFLLKQAENKFTRTMLRGRKR